MADWILLPLLCTPEAAVLRQWADMEPEQPALSDGGWQVRLCVGERNAKGNPIATPYGAGNTMYHRLLQQLAELQLQDVLSMSRLLSLSASRMTQETVLLITPYTDRRVARWKQQSGGLVLVTGHAHDSGNCADAVVPAPEYLRNGEAAL